MAILFVGSTVADFGGNTIPNTSTNARDPNFTPVGIQITADPDESGSAFNVITPSASGDVWLHFYHKTDRFMAYGDRGDGYLWRWFSGGVEVGRLDLKNDEWFLEGGGQSIPVTKLLTNINMTYDFKFTQDGTTVTISMYTNGVLEGSISYLSALGPVDQFNFDHYDLLWNSGLRTWYYSEVIITDDEPTLGWRLSTLTPNTNGNYNEWAGDVAGVQGVADGQSISSDTPNERQSWTLSTYGGPATSSGVRAVVNKIIASDGAGSGPSNITPFTRHGSTDHDGTAYSPDGLAKMVILDDDPDTGLTWDTADLATLEVGVKSET